MAKRQQRRQSLTPIPFNAEPQLKTYLQALQEITEVGEGVRGDPLDRKLTVRDLVAAGILSVKGSTSTGGYIDESTLTPGTSIKDMAIPPRPTGFMAVSVIGGNMLMWDNPHGKYTNHSHTEIWRAEITDDAPNPRFANSTLIGLSKGSSYTDRTSVGATTYIYWIRFISTSDIKGPIHKPDGTTLLTIKSALRILQELNEEFADTEASAGQPEVDFIIDAKRFAIRTGIGDERKIPFAVLEDGTVIIQNVLIDEGILGPISFGKLVAEDGTPVTTVSGKLKAEHIDVENLSVGSAADFSGDLFSTGFETGVRGWRLRKNGDIELNGAQIRGLLDFGQITVKGRPGSEVKTLPNRTASAVVPQVRETAWSTTSESGSNHVSVTFLDSTPTGRFDVRGGININLNIVGTIRSGDTYWDGSGDYTYTPSSVTATAIVTVYALLNNTEQHMVAQKTLSITGNSSSGTKSTSPGDETVNKTTTEFVAFSALGHIGEASSASAGFRIHVSLHRLAIPAQRDGIVDVEASCTATTDGAYAYLNRF